MKSLIEEITQRIEEKSKPTREAYLARIDGMKNRTRGADRLGCANVAHAIACLLYTSPSPRDRTRSRMPSSA